MIYLINYPIIDIEKSIIVYLWYIYNAQTLQNGGRGALFTRVTKQRINKRTVRIHITLAQIKLGHAYL